MSENYLDKVLLSSIESMSKEEWSWPEHWDKKLKLKFLDECLDWLETHEHYEHCSMIINEKEKI